jgi:uncharacterized membrane protein
MGLTIKMAVLGAVAFMVLDGLWLGVLMKNFYWPAAFVVYVLLGAGIALFVIPRAPSVPQAAAYGALFGLVVYGVYDFTNYSTLRQWPLALVFVDVSWGIVASAACAAAVRIAIR